MDGSSRGMGTLCTLTRREGRGIRFCIVSGGGSQRKALSAMIPFHAGTRKPADVGATGRSPLRASVLVLHDWSEGGGRKGLHPELGRLHVLPRLAAPEFVAGFEDLKKGQVCVNGDIALLAGLGGQCADCH